VYSILNINTRLFVLISSLSILLSCSESNQESMVPDRWYSKSQVSEGEILFDANCVSCHGVKARGTVRDWKQPLEDGSYPPPPLNGTAHTWHHPKKSLVQTINNGGIAIGGKMPGFKDQLNNEQVDALIAYFQSLWSDEIYEAWESRNN